MSIFYSSFNDNNVVFRKEKVMQIYDEKAYNWNKGVAPEGNMAGVHPQNVADLCDKYEIPWFTTGWPYSSGLSAYCLDNELWRKIIKLSK